MCAAGKEFSMTDDSGLPLAILQVPDSDPFIQYDEAAARVGCRAAH